MAFLPLIGGGLLAKSAVNTAASLTNLYDIFAESVDVINRDAPNILEATRSYQEELRNYMAEIFTRFEIKKINAPTTAGKNILLETVAKATGQNFDVAKSFVTSIGMDNDEFLQNLKQITEKNKHLAGSTDTARLFTDIFQDDEFGDKARYFYAKLELFDLLKDNPQTPKYILDQLKPNVVDEVDINRLREGARDMILCANHTTKYIYHQHCNGVISALLKLRGEEFTEERITQNLLTFHLQNSQDKSIIFSLLPSDQTARDRIAQEVEKIKPGYGYQVVEYFNRMNDGAITDLLTKHRSFTQKIWGNMVTAAYSNALMDESEGQVWMSIYDKTAMQMFNREMVYMANAIKNNEEIYATKNPNPQTNEDRTGYALTKPEYYKAREYIIENKDKLEKICGKFDFDPYTGNNLSQKDVVTVLRRVLIDNVYENTSAARAFGGRDKDDLAIRFTDRYELSLSLDIGVPKTIANLPKGKLRGNIEAGTTEKEKSSLKLQVPHGEMLKAFAGFLDIQTNSGSPLLVEKCIRNRVIIKNEINSNYVSKDGWDYEKTPFRDPTDWKYKENELGEPVWKEAAMRVRVRNALTPDYTSPAPNMVDVAKGWVDHAKKTGNKLNLFNLSGLIKTFSDPFRSNKGGILSSSDKSLFGRVKNMGKKSTESNSNIFSNSNNYNNVNNGSRGHNKGARKESSNKKTGKVLKTIGMFLFPPTTPYVVGGWAGDFFHGSALSRVIGRTVMYSAALYAGIKEGPALENAIWPDYKIDNNIEDVRGYLGDKKITNVITLDSKQDIVLHDGERMALGYEGGAAAILKVKDDSLQISNIGIGSKAYMYKDKNGEEKIAYIDVHGSDASISTDPAKSLTGDGYFRKEEPVKGVMKDNDVSGKQPEEIIHMLDTKPMNINNNQLNK